MGWDVFLDCRRHLLPFELTGNLVEEIGARKSRKQSDGDTARTTCVYFPLAFIILQMCPFKALVSFLRNYQRSHRHCCCNCNRLLFHSSLSNEDCGRANRFHARRSTSRCLIGSSFLAQSMAILPSRPFYTHVQVHMNAKSCC